MSFKNKLRPGNCENKYLYNDIYIGLSRAIEDDKIKMNHSILSELTTYKKLIHSFDWSYFSGRFSKGEKQVALFIRQRAYELIKDL